MFAHFQNMSRIFCDTCENFAKFNLYFSIKEPSFESFPRSSPASNSAMNSVLVLVFCSAAALAQNASAPVAPYSLDYYGVPWKTGSFEKNIMKFAIGQWNGADEVEKVDAYMTEVAQVYQAIFYNFLDESFEMRNTTTFVQFKGEKNKKHTTLYKYNVYMYDGEIRKRRMVLDSSFFVVRYFKIPSQNQNNSNWETTTSGGDYWETTTTNDYWETTTGGDYWETTTTTTGSDNWETTTGDDYWETTTTTTTGSNNWETTTGDDYWETTTGDDYWETTTTTTSGHIRMETTTGDRLETTSSDAMRMMETASDDYNWETSSDSYDSWETATDFYDNWYDNWDWETSSDSFDNWETSTDDYDFETTDGPMMG